MDSHLLNRGVLGFPEDLGDLDTRRADFNRTRH